MNPSTGARARWRSFPDAELTEAVVKLRRDGDEVEPFDDAELVSCGRWPGRPPGAGLSERPFDVQLMAVSFWGTGQWPREGKTLAGALARPGMPLRAAGDVMTVNDYLAHRDAAWMRPSTSLLGVSSLGESDVHREDAGGLRRGHTYGSVSEIGFDVLRDGCAPKPRRW